MESPPGIKKLLALPLAFLLAALLLVPGCEPESSITGGDDDDDDTPPDTTDIPGWYALTLHSIHTATPSFVNIMFQVTDEHGLGVTDLVTSDFRVMEDLEPVSPTESAMHIRKKEATAYTMPTALMLDNSSSVADSLSAIKQAATTLVESIVPGQEFAIYSFSDEVELVQGYTDNVATLRAAIASISVGFPTTDLYGAVIEAAQSYADNYDPEQVVQGSIILLTDGSDTQAAHTLSDAVEARAGRRLYAIGLGDEIEPEALEQLGNAAYVHLDRIDLLEEQFQEVQQQIERYANSFYWLQYMSPRRGDREHELRLSVPANVNTDLNSYLEGSFNSAPFYSVLRGLAINPSDYFPDGQDSLFTRLEDTLAVRAVSYMVNETPIYTWISPTPSMVSVEEIPPRNSAARLFVQAAAPTVVPVLVRDTVNDLEQTVQVALGYLAPYSQRFEGSGFPQDWWHDDSYITVVIQDDDVYQGSQSLKVRKENGDMSGGGVGYHARVPQDEIVTVQFALKNPLGAIRFTHVGSIEPTGQDPFHVEEIRPDWELVTYQFTTDDTGYLDLSWTFYQNAGGEFFLDDVAVIF